MLRLPKIGLWVFCAASLQAQTVVSTHAGLITEVHGAAYLDDRPLTPQDKLFGQIQIQMKDRQILRTDKGQATLSISPDADLSLDPNSELRMDDSRFEQTQMTLLRGAATIGRQKSIEVPGGKPIRIQVGEAWVEIATSGPNSWFRIDADNRRVEVIRSRATIHAKGKELTIGDGKNMDLNTLAVSGMDERAATALSQGWESPVALFSCLAGEFYIDSDRFTMQEFAGQPKLIDGQSFRIEQGWAELQFLGVTFRVGHGTVLHLSGKEIVFERGVLVGSLPVIYVSRSPSFRFGDRTFRFQGQGALFQFENPPGVLRIYRGQSEAESQGMTTKIGGGKVVDLSSLTIQKLDRGKTPPLFDAPNGYFTMDAQLYARPLNYAPGPVGAGGQPTPILPQREHCMGPRVFSR